MKIWVGWRFDRRQTVFASHLARPTGPAHDRFMLNTGPPIAMRRYLRLLAVAGLAGLTACSSLLPVGTDTTRMPWSEFDEARQAIEKLEPNVSLRSELSTDGFDPYRNPAVTILSWPDLVQKFASVNAPNTRDLDPGLRACLSVGNRCSGLSINVKKIRRQRLGNFWMDSLAFRREVLVSGWTFNALIVFVDDRVVYRSFGGQPRMEEVTVTRNPLGPIQGWGDSLGQIMLR